MAKATYKDAGVDLDVYRKSMERLTRLLHRTSSPRVIELDRNFSGAGAFSRGFARVFQLDFASTLFARRYQEPVLVSCTDGVGTKLKVATLTGIHDTIGLDLVAMSVNDAICLGAEPLFFLDYISMSHDDPDLLEQVVEGISAGCLASDCALLGGETAIMPDLYARGDYDLAGFCVGVVEKSHMLDGHSIAPEDIVIGVASSGLHSNGYSLARKVVFEMAGLGVDDFIDELGQTVGQVMLEPTRIYVKPVRKILDYYKVKSVVHGIAHITGGGLRENLERILPVGLEARIERGSWTPPSVFHWIQKLGEIDDAEMERVFNMGIGLVLVVSPYYAQSVQSQLAENSLESWQIGKVAEGIKGAVWA